MPRLSMLTSLDKNMCPNCKDTGIVINEVPFGSTTLKEYLYCDCREGDRERNFDKRIAHGKVCDNWSMVENTCEGHGPDQITFPEMI